MKLTKSNRKDMERSANKKGKKGKKLYQKKRSLDYVEWRSFRPDQDGYGCEDESEDTRGLVAEEKELEALGWRFLP